MKLRKKDRAQLEHVLDGLKRGIGFVLQPDTSLMRRRDNAGSCDFFASTFPEYVGQKWFPIAKDIGCEFALTISAMQRLERLLLEPEDGSIPTDNL